MEGAYLAHSVYGFFQNGGSLCWIVRVGSRRRRRAARRARRCPPRATRASRRSARSRSRASTDPVTVELTEEPGSRAAKDGERRRRTSSSSRPATEREEHEGLTLKKGRTNIATKVNAASKLIKIEETGASLPETRVRAPAPTRCRRRRRRRETSTPADFEGDVAKR